MSLQSKIVNIIKFKGPLTVADYMKIVLTNPESGFYMNDDVFGVKGHFSTSPEISQTFGEILGAWIMQEWHRFGCPKPMRLVEFGPGRGTLMSDISRTILQLDKQLKASDDSSIQINMIEISPKLEEIQRQTLAKQSQDLVNRTNWFTSIDALPKHTQESGFTAFLAHEYIDALPIHKFVKDPKTGLWRDLLIDYDQSQNLRFCIANKPSLSSSLLVNEKSKGDHIEVCAEGALQLEKVTRHLNASKKGCMLVCDYGFEDEPDDSEQLEAKNKKIRTLKPIRSSRDTFRAFKDHQPWPPLKEPGLADLTADVDFGYLKKNLADKALIFGTVDQRSFLLKCGLQARLKMLLDNCKSEDQKNDLISGANMMLQAMGERYKFMSLFPKDCGDLFKDDPPAGFCDRDINVLE